MAAKGRLSSSETQYLISLYHGHRALWDVQCPQYRNKNERNWALRSIQLAFLKAYGLKLEVNVIKTKIHSFRNGMNKEIGRMAQFARFGTGADDFYKPKYEFFKELEFLKDVLKKKPPDSESNLDDSQSHLSQMNDWCTKDCQPQEKVAGWKTELPDPATPTSTAVSDSPPDDAHSQLSQINDSCVSDCQLPDSDAAWKTELPGPETPASTTASDSPRVPQQEDVQLFDLTTQRSQKLPTTPVSTQLPTFNMCRPEIAEVSCKGKGFKRKRKETESDRAILNSISSYLAAKSKAKQSEEDSANTVWAKQLVHDIESLQNIKTQKLLKIKIARLVHDTILEELENE